MDVKAETQRSDLELFREEMQTESARKVAKADAREGVRRTARHKHQQECRLQLKRAIYYLSMKPAICSSPAWLEHPLLDPLTLADNANGGLERNPSVWFVCIDVEAYEHDQNCITEIGISILNTDNLIGVSGGVGNANWAEKIVSRHFCISEYRHLRNKDFVQGCPANFQFGDSEWIKERDAPAAIQACFTPTPSFGAGNGVPSVVFVAQHVESDVKYLQGLGLEPLALVNDCLDTAKLYQSLRRQGHSTSLASILLDLNIGAKYLHNAGNDARYTLHALLSIAYQHTYRQKSAAAWKADLESRIQIAIQEAESRVTTDFAGWESDDDEEIMLNTSLQKALHKEVRVKAQSAAMVGEQWPPLRPAQPSGIPREIAVGTGSIQSNRGIGGAGSRGSNFYSRRGDGTSSSRAARGFGRGRGSGNWNGNRNENGSEMGVALVRRGRGGRGMGPGSGRGHEPGSGRGRGQGRAYVGHCVT